MGMLIDVMTGLISSVISGKSTGRRNSTILDGQLDDMTE